MVTKNSNTDIELKRKKYKALLSSIAGIKKLPTKDKKYIEKNIDWMVEKLINFSEKINQLIKTSVNKKISMKDKISKISSDLGITNDEAEKLTNAVSSPQGITKLNIKDPTKTLQKGGAEEDEEGEEDDSSDGNYKEKSETAKKKIEETKNKIKGMDTNAVFCFSNLPWLAVRMFTHGPKYVLLTVSKLFYDFATLYELDWHYFEDFTKKIDWVFIFLFILAATPGVVGVISDLIIIVRAIKEQRMFLAILTFITSFASLFVFRILDLGLLIKILYFLDVTSYNSLEEGDVPNKRDGAAFYQKITEQLRNEAKDAPPKPVKDAMKEMKDNLMLMNDNLKMIADQNPNVARLNAEKELKKQKEINAQAQEEITQKILNDPRLAAAVKENPELQDEMVDAVKKEKRKGLSMGAKMALGAAGLGAAGLAAYGAKKYFDKKKSKKAEKEANLKSENDKKIYDRKLNSIIAPGEGFSDGEQSIDLSSVETEPKPKMVKVKQYMLPKFYDIFFHRYNLRAYKNQKIGFYLAERRVGDSLDNSEKHVFIKKISPEILNSEIIDGYIDKNFLPITFDSVSADKNDKIKNDINIVKVKFSRDGFEKEKRINSEGEIIDFDKFENPLNFVKEGDIVRMIGNINLDNNVTDRDYIINELKKIKKNNYINNIFGADTYEPLTMRLEREKIITCEKPKPLSQIFHLVFYGKKLGFDFKVRKTTENIKNAETNRFEEKIINYLEIDKLSTNDCDKKNIETIELLEPLDRILQVGNFHISSKLSKKNIHSVLSGNVFNPNITKTEFLNIINNRKNKKIPIVIKFQRPDSKYQAYLKRFEKKIENKAIITEEPENLPEEDKACYGISPSTSSTPKTAAAAASLAALGSLENPVRSTTIPVAESKVIEESSSTTINPSAPVGSEANPVQANNLIPVVQATPVAASIAATNIVNSNQDNKTKNSKNVWRKSSIELFTKSLKVPTGKKKIHINPFKFKGLEEKKVLVKLDKNMKPGDNVEVKIETPHKKFHVILPDNYNGGNVSKTINKIKYQIKLPENAKKNEIYIFKIPANKNKKLVKLVEKFELPTEVLAVKKNITDTPQEKKAEEEAKKKEEEDRIKAEEEAKKKEEEDRIKAEEEAKKKKEEEDRIKAEEEAKKKKEEEDRIKAEEEAKKKEEEDRIKAEEESKKKKEEEDRIKSEEESKKKKEEEDRIKAEEEAKKKKEEEDRIKAEEEAKKKKEEEDRIKAEEEAKKKKEVEEKKKAEEEKKKKAAAKKKAEEEKKKKAAAKKKAEEEKKKREAEKEDDDDDDDDEEIDSMVIGDDDDDDDDDSD